VGVKIPPTAAYEPRARQTRSKGVGGKSLIDRRINRWFKKINSRLLHGALEFAQHQPMVDTPPHETMADRLREMAEGLSLEEFGALAGVTAQAALKWLKGGNVKDATLAKLVSHPRFNGTGWTVEWVRYGTMPGKTAAPKELSMMAIDVARRWMALSAERQDFLRDLIFSMSFMESRFPAMKKVRPKGEHWAGFESALQREMAQAVKVK
jgi:transcriptional regulator with XRE-family HTH domain